VTVCIAAICQEISDPKIVLCADTKLDGSYAGSSDGNRKIGKLAFGWVDMMSGDWVRAKELHGWIKSEFLANGAPSDRGRVFELLMNAGNSFIGSPMYRKDAAVDILACGFIGAVPVISGVSIGSTTKPSVYFNQSFATVGSGGAIAAVFLNARDCTPRDSLKQALYVVYEAKKYSEKNVGVGTDTKLIVISPPVVGSGPEDVSAVSVGFEGLRQLEKARGQYGLQYIWELPDPLNPVAPPDPPPPTADQ
jgi:hypothetical protein